MMKKRSKLPKSDLTEDPTEIDEGEKSVLFISRRYKAFIFFILLCGAILWNFRHTKLSLKVSDEEEKIKANSKEKNSDSDIPTWTVLHPPLVQKRPSRDCKINKIAPQVNEPLVYLNNDGDKTWYRRAFSCIDKCPHHLLTEFESRRWKNIEGTKSKSFNGRTWDATFAFIDSSTLENMQKSEYDTFVELMFNRESLTYVNSILSSSGDLSRLFQFEHRVQLANELGCSYRKLNMEKPKEEVTKWLVFKSQVPVIRAHMIFASTYPHIILTKLSHVLLGKRKLTTDEFQNEMASSGSTGSHYVDTLLYSAIKKELLWVFHSIRSEIVRRRGSFLVVTAEFKIDDIYHVFLNQIIVNSDMKGLISSNEYGEILDLVQELQEVPVVFNSLDKGDKYGNWEILFSERQESCEKLVYNPCTVAEFNVRDLKKANQKVSKVHNTANRERHEEARIAKKMEEQKRDRCRNEKLVYPSARCDKYQQTLDQEKFETLFEEHERSYNPNQFVLAKPGETFAWEEV